jgi:hypothetical protein
MVGAGLGSALHDLARRGWGVIAISPEAEEIERAARSAEGNQATLHCVAFEEHRDPNSDVILYFEPWHEIPEYVLFGHGRSLLNRTGHIVIACKFATGSPVASVPAMRYRNSYINHAQRAGFDLIEEYDYSHLVVPYTARMITLLQEYRSAQGTDSNRQAEIADALLKIYQRERALFETSHIAYGLLSFKRSASREGLYIRPYRNGDEWQINELFQRVFEQDQTDTWSWKFRACGHSSYAVLAFQGNKLVAQYTGLARTFLMRDREVAAVQVCDIMVDKSARGQRKLDGPFAGTAKTFIGMFMGQGKIFEFAYGFPSARHFKLGARLGLYEEICSFWNYGSEPLRSCNNLLWRMRPVIGVGPLLRIVGLLWKKMRVDFQHDAIGVRDADYVKWRYVDHPRFRYRFLVLNHLLSSRPKALAVVRVSDECATIVDILGQKRFFGLALRLVEDHLRSDENVTRLDMFISEGYRWLIDACGLVATKTEIVIPRIILDGAPCVSELRDRLFVTAGDSDLY